MCTGVTKIRHKMYGKDTKKIMGLDANALYLCKYYRYQTHDQKRKRDYSSEKDIIR